MKNPEKQTAHEKRICKQLDQIEREQDRVVNLPATVANRLRIIQLELRAQVLLHSFYTKDPEETLEGLQLLTLETQIKQSYELLLHRVSYILDNLDKWKGQKVDISSIEDQVPIPHYRADW